MAASRRTRPGREPRRVAIVMNLQFAVKRHQAIFAGAYRYARQKGWQVDTMPFSKQIYAAARREADYDGIIARADRKLANYADAAGIPLVNCWYSSPVRNMPLVNVDYRRIGGLASDHLQARGFRRFATAGYSGARSSSDAEEGFRAATDGFGQIDSFITSLGFGGSPESFARFERSAGSWLDALPRPVGVFVTDDVLARHLINVAIVRGIKIPEELAFVGMFNDEPFCLLADPTITSIECRFDRVGYRSGRLLEALMNGQATPDEPLLLPPGQLIPRDTTDMFASGDELVAQALRFIADNCHKPINVTTVAEKLRVCGRTLARHFKQERGCRVIDELTRMRITRAKRLLVESDVPIRTVAEQCGFATSTQFILAFRRVEGTTPGDYRSRHEATILSGL